MINDKPMTFKQWLWHKHGIDYDHSLKFHELTEKQISAWKEAYQKYYNEEK